MELTSKVSSFPTQVTKETEIWGSFNQLPSGVKHTVHWKCAFISWSLMTNLCVTIPQEVMRTEFRP